MKYKTEAGKIDLDTQDIIVVLGDRHKNTPMISVGIIQHFNNVIPNESFTSYVKSDEPKRYITLRNINTFIDKSDDNNEISQKIAAVNGIVMMTKLIMPKDIIFKFPFKSTETNYQGLLLGAINQKCIDTSQFNAPGNIAPICKVELIDNLPKEYYEKFGYQLNRPLFYIYDLNSIHEYLRGLILVSTPKGKAIIPMKNIRKCSEQTFKNISAS